MRKFFLLLLSFITSVTVCQKKVLKKITSTATEVAISTEGLDSFTLENSNSKFIEVFLYAENPNKQHIIVDENNNELEIKFKIANLKTPETVFRKYITERLKRASATIKLPKNINVVIFGDYINIHSKSFRGNLRMFLENGIVKLDTIQKDLELKMFAGNVFGNFKNTNLNVISKNGKIKIDSVFYQKKHQEINSKNFKKLTITSNKGNIYLTHL